MPWFVYGALTTMPARTPGSRRAGLARRLGVVPPALKSGADGAQERTLDRTARAIADAAAREAIARATHAPAPEGLAIPEAAAALGVSLRTLRRRQAAGELAIDARTPWGTPAISEAELSRHRAVPRPARGGRPRVLPEEVAARAARLRARGLSYARIGAALEAAGLPTAHGGRRWWASSVRALLARPPADATTPQAGEQLRLLAPEGRPGASSAPRAPDPTR